MNVGNTQYHEHSKPTGNDLKHYEGFWETMGFSVRNCNYGAVAYITWVHFLGFAGLLRLHSCAWQTLVFACILYFVSGTGITAGAHRLWAHRSYEACLPLRIFLMLCCSLANQGSIYHWARDHRVHHKFSETDADPHNACRGLFFSHMGWLLTKKHPDVIKKGKLLSTEDLKGDPVVMFQRRLDPWFSLGICFLLPGLVATLWGDSFYNGVMVAGMARYVCVLHGTWLVNSIGHLYGMRPYDPRSNPSENFIVSIFALGEGWHNWHHKYPFDYAASEYGVLIQFNTTKLLIDSWARLGLVHNRKRALKMWERRKKTEKERGGGRTGFPRTPLGTYATGGS